MGFKQPLKYLTDYPEIMKEWDWDKNKDLNPKTLTFGSEQIVWWKCERGHQWAAPVHYRTKGYKCPVCAGKRTAPLISDILTLYPELSKEWHPTLNIMPVPIGISPSCQHYAVWKCEHGHIWMESVYYRAKTISRHDCPYCSGKKIWNMQAAMEHINLLRSMLDYQRRLLYQVQPYIQEYQKFKKEGKSYE